MIGNVILINFEFFNYLFYTLKGYPKPATLPCNPLFISLSPSQSLRRPHNALRIQKRCR